jgi:hypothetical protein
MPHMPIAAQRTTYSDPSLVFAKEPEHPQTLTAALDQPIATPGDL